MVRQKIRKTFLTAVLVFAAVFAMPRDASAAEGAAQESAALVAVTGLSVGRNAVTEGESLELFVSTTAAAESVHAICNGAFVSGVMLRDNGAVKDWTVIIEPYVTQTVKVRVSAAAEAETDVPAVTIDVPVIVTTESTQFTAARQVNANVAITDISEIYSGDIAELTVKTGTAANNVWVEFDGGLYVQGSLMASEPGGKVWSVRFIPSGAQTVTVSSNIAYKKNGAFNKEFTVAGPAAAPVPAAEMEREVLTLVNQERRNAGLPELTADDGLFKAAEVRAEELSREYSHDRPGGESCFTVLDEFNITYSTTSENIASGSPNAAEVMEGWMGTQGHKDNILSEDFTRLGVGCYESEGTLYWVQLFAGE